MLPPRGNWIVCGHGRFGRFDQFDQQRIVRLAPPVGQRRQRAAVGQGGRSGSGGQRRVELRRNGRSNLRGRARQAAAAERQRHANGGANPLNRAESHETGFLFEGARAALARLGLEGA